jgi:tRNA (cmo5U34)-methyltransferase
VAAGICSPFRVALLKASRLPLFPLIVAREKLARGERERVPEPMVMEEPQGVREYDEIGGSVQVGIHHFNALGISRLLPRGGMLLDLGCGSGRLLARLAHGRPDARLVGLDLSEPMLQTGQRLLEREGLADRVELRRGDITTFDAELPEPFDVVSCNFTLHQLPTEDLVRRCLEAIARFRSRTGCAVWIFDFARLRHPRSWPAFASIVNWPGTAVHHDALASEQAAFTLDELTAMLERAGLTDIEHVRSRPLGEYQVHRAAGRDQAAPVTGLWQDSPLPPGTDLLRRIALSSFPRSLWRA